MLGAGCRFQNLFCRLAGKFLKQTDVAHSNSRDAADGAACDKPDPAVVKVDALAISRDTNEAVNELGVIRSTADQLLKPDQPLRR
jgi:hypothetical protein